MKKSTFTMLLMLVLVTTGPCLRAQVAYYDALQLKALLRNGKWPPDPKVDSLLRKYLNKDETVKSQFQLDNPFTYDLFQSVLTSSSEGPLGSWMSSAGALDVTTLADGFSKFLVARTKEELSVAFFEKLKSLINDPKYEDARMLFPQTVVTLNVIGEEIYNYPAYLNALRESFEKDLNGMLTRLYVVMKDTTRYGWFFKENPGLRALCLSSLYVGNGLLNKEHPGTIIAGYDASLLDPVSTRNKYIKGSVQTLQLVSNSIRSGSADHYWVPPDSLKLLFEDHQVGDIYLGLLFQKGGDILFTDSDSLRTVLRKAKSIDQGIERVLAFVDGFSKQAGTVTTSIERLEGKSSSKISYIDYSNYFNSVLDLVEYGSTVFQLPVLEERLGALKSSPGYRKFTKILRAGGNLAVDINRRNYSASIINSFELYRYAFTVDKSDKLFQRIDDLTSGTKDFLLHYGSFFASVAQAQNSDEVQRAIEAAALPAGSSSIKRHSSFDISLNAYAGLFGAYEQIEGHDSQAKWNAGGVTAPIGIALGGSSGGWSYSMFASIVDLGAVTAFRFNDNTSKDIPTVRLRDIISPGLYLSLGFPSCPISLNIGTQMGPNLHALSSGLADLSTATSRRYGISLCVDIPLVSFYNDPKN